jgi:hypothetical protein
MTSDIRQQRERAVIHAFFLPGSAARIAASLSAPGEVLHAADVSRIWRDAKRRGDLPAIDRQPGGPRLQPRRDGR